jgi:hypothetical protein
VIKQEITCDHCKRDLSSTGNSIDYAITVKNRRLPSVGGSVTNMMIYPQLENDLDFCGLGCLKKYFLEMSK